MACIVLLALLSLGSCAVYRPVAAPTHPLQQGRAQARNEMPVLDLRVESIPTDFMQTYLDTYQLNFESITHRHVWGTFQSGDYTLVAQVFIPENSRGTLFALHGYLDHTGTLRHFIQYGLEKGYTVALYDLPGHGLSSGPYASIPSFHEYACVFSDFLDLAVPQLPPPYHLVSHSTGSAITLEFLSRQTTNPFDQVILLAPLVRHAYWCPAKFFFHLGQLLQFKTVPRRYPPVSGDPEFLAFRKKDPLSFKRVPMQWVAAVYAWEKHLQKWDFSSCPDLVIQGTRDSIVDGAYNVKFLQTKCPEIHVTWIEGGKHQLLNESPPLRQAVLETIFEEMGPVGVQSHLPRQNPREHRSPYPSHYSNGSCVYCVQDEL